MTECDRNFVRQTLAMALGFVLMMPDTETKSEMVERLKRSIEKVDAQPVSDAFLAGVDYARKVDAAKQKP